MEHCTEIISTSFPSLILASKIISATATFFFYENFEMTVLEVQREEKSD